MYTQTRTEGFGDEVKRRILLGTFVLSVGYYDAYFAKAQKVRRLIKERFDEWLAAYDGILIPTAPTTAWRLDEQKSPVEMYLADIFSVLANLCGLPALSIPIGLDDQNLPVGMQILAARFKEENLFHLAQEIYQ
jgi:aspartyl-tRNA(Asn)/glutamyl-tRNA(Gln) amidotransferase subunit A